MYTRLIERCIVRAMTTTSDKQWGPERAAACAALIEEHFLPETSTDRRLEILREMGLARSWMWVFGSRPIVIPLRILKTFSSESVTRTLMRAMLPTPA